jgi:glutamate formiminotransferase / 5-formyltetrahydrofolate cyclo-ligase
VLECVVNVSEGRDMTCLRALANAAGDALLDVHVDPDHHRSVFTLCSRDPQQTEAAVRAFAAAVAARVSLVQHAGEHPRLGALDVVPFVALEASTAERRRAIDAARAFGAWWAETYDVPVFLYGNADSERRHLPDVRRDAFRSRLPDYGPSTPHAHLGATAVGARDPLVAINCRLASADLDVVRRIARRVRERDGGLAGVRALGFMLATRQRVQVSMNLVDLDRTGLEAACVRVRELARDAGTDVEAVELVGLVPRRVMERCSEAFLAWSALDPLATIEARLEVGPRWLPGDPVPTVRT